MNTISSVFVIILPFLSHLSFADELYEIKTIDHNPGIYFENVANAQFFNNEWKLLTYVDMQVYFETLDKIENYNQKTSRICSEVKRTISSNCDKYIATTSEIIQKSKVQIGVVQEITGANVFPVRNKRGLFNIIGKAEKYLFGTADSDDALYYDKTISEIAKNEREMRELMLKQTSVMQSTVHSVNQTVSNIVHNELIFQKNLNVLENVSKSLYSEISTSVKNFDIEMNFLEHANLLSEILNHYHSDLQNLINALTIARIGQIHPFIISPSQLISEIKKTLPYLPPGLHYPIFLSMENYHLLLDIAELDIVVVSNKLIVAVKIPLVKDEEFTVYKLHPLPTRINSSTAYVFIQPSTPYLAVDKTKQLFIRISDSELNQCKVLKSERLCKQNQPTRLVINSEICEIGLFSYRYNNYKSCDIRIIELTHNIWHRITNSNTWLYVIVTEKETITLNCADRKSPLDVHLSKTGALTLNSKCIAYGVDVKLIPFHSYDSETALKLNFIPSIDILDECCEQEIKSEHVNITMPHLSKDYKSVISSLEELKLSSFKLNNIHEKLQETQDIHVRTLVNYSYVIFAIVIIVFLIFLYCKCCKKNQKYSVTPYTCSCSKLGGFCLKIFNVQKNERRSSHLDIEHDESLELHSLENVPGSSSEHSHSKNKILAPIKSRRSTYT
ncbi:uncharacterized protein LOC112903855 [Agrilus planipennis]|uniref:Uncharacterized protein LOC112903855 n=1 Tax=Agrilus planipennis TaxID=224129 RepID=A0A7F5RKF7_AGRPL|nr:uncharacterized protein LOC112903855 [Agrilus planipennis]